MRKYVTAAVLLLTPVPAFAEDEAAPPKPITVSGSVGLVSDYRFRGVSQSDRGVAVQGGLSATHNKTGIYVGTWASNLSGWGTFGGANLELDVYGGVKVPIKGATLDVGLTWYMYPQGYAKTDFAEPYVKLSGTVGPVSLAGGVAYAPEQQALGNWSNTPESRPGDKEDNLYVWGDVSGGIPGLPLTLKGHVGYSDGNPGLGPNGTSVAPTGSYADWLIGADYALGPLTLGVAYVDTSITRAGSAYLQPNFSRTKDGASIAGAAVVFSIGASF